MMVIGVTGSFGSGKTFVASVFRGLGAKVLDADKIAHAVIQRGRPSYKRIITLFGEGILDRSRQIDRKRLGQIVFKDKSALRDLNNIVHPEVMKFIKDKIKKAKKKDVMVIDAPLLIEANLCGIVDRLVVVKASPENQFERCARKFGVNKKDFLRRVKNQIPMGEKIKLADFVIDNDGTKSETKRKVLKIWREVYGNS